MYFVDRNNHTGYAQVVEEMNEEGVLVSRYHYGHDLVAADKADKADLTSVSDPVLNPRAEYRRHYYHYDGLGSVRAISEENGDTTEEYHYDAYGILIDFRKRDSTSGQLTSHPIENFAQESTNRYLFTGEQFDTDLGMYYLRARYLNTQTGRFHNMDTYEGRTGEPQTLHKYLYAHSNPVSNIDPSGNLSLPSLATTIRFATSLATPAFSLISLGTRVIAGAVQSLAITLYRNYYIPRVYEEVTNLHGTTQNSFKRAAINKAQSEIIKLNAEITGKASLSVITAQLGGVINGYLLYSVLSDLNEELIFVLKPLAAASGVRLSFDPELIRGGLNLALGVAQPENIVQEIGNINSAIGDSESISQIQRARLEAYRGNIEFELNKYGESSVNFIR